jgi:hypothetical protein
VQQAGDGDLGAAWTQWKRRHLAAN